MMRFRYIPIAGIMIATGLAVAACGTSQGNASAGSSSPAVSPSASVTPSPVASSTGATVTSSSSGNAYGEARSEWLLSFKAPLASIGQYYLAAAKDLAGNPSYAKAFSELNYLASIPDSNATATQIANGNAYTNDLDSFFGTPSSDSAYDQARSEWLLSFKAPLASIGQYYLAAAKDLAGNPSYAKAFSELRYLASIPDSNATPTQIANGNAYEKELDSFFGTPNAQ